MSFYHEKRYETKHDLIVGVQMADLPQSVKTLVTEDVVKAYPDNVPLYVKASGHFFDGNNYEVSSLNVEIHRCV